MENIDNLLRDLDNGIFEGNEDDISDTYVTATIVEKEKGESCSGNNDVDKDFEVTKKAANSKYTGYALEIHQKLKQDRLNGTTDTCDGRKKSWRAKAVSESKDQLSAPKSIVTGKVDVYAEPIFGLRMINPLVSAQFIQTKMIGKLPVPVGNIGYHLRCGDKNADWVFAGAIVFKSGLKTSQKGSQYCTWKVSDLKHDLQTVSVCLFSKACSDLWKLSLGTVIAILNASPFNKDEKYGAKDDITLSVRSPDQVMIFGGSKDYGLCKAKKKNGENCTSFVNKSVCEFCVYHVKTEYNKFSNQRPDLQSTNFGGLTGLRNKVLGKNEVFYGGKSYSALKPPLRNSKITKRDNQLLNMMHSKPASNTFLNQFDTKKFQTSSKEPLQPQIETKNENIKNQNCSDDIKENAKTEIVPKNIKNSGKEDVKENVTTKITSTNPKNPVPGYASRLHLLKEAGQRMIETGETTRVTFKPQKKIGQCSFATVFNSSETESSDLKLELEKRKQTKSDKNITKNPSSNSSVKKLSHLDFELEVEPGSSNLKTMRSEILSKSNDISNVERTINSKPSSSKKFEKSSEIELHIESLNSSKTLKFSHKSLAERELSSNTCSNPQIKCNPSINLGVTGISASSPMIHSNDDKSNILKNNKRSMIISSRLEKCNEKVSLPSNSISKLAEENIEKKSSPRNKYETNSTVAEGNFSSQININLLRSQRPNFHERKKEMEKMNAINVIKKQGGLAKSNPNRVKPNLENKQSLKRRLEEEEKEKEEEQNLSGKSVLSERFIDLMNATSRHENLVETAEMIERQNYFNKLEKKEQLEEKMLNTYKVACKAVTCLKCKYKWFSASDLCKAQNHPIKVVDAVKRFFKCNNCTNRTVTLELIPLTNCKNCGNAKWSRAPMMREKIVKSDHHLCIRGDEQKNLNSLSGTVNLNLLVSE